MATIQELNALGDSIGLQGESLQPFIKEKQVEERNKRTVEREERENEKEFRDREKELKAQEREKERRFELEKLKFAKEQQELELNMEKERINADLLRSPNQLPLSTEDVGLTENNGMAMKCRAKVPRMPCFDEEKDFMDSDLNPLGQYADVNRWRRADRMGEETRVAAVVTRSQSKPTDLQQTDKDISKLSMQKQGKWKGGNWQAKATSTQVYVGHLSDSVSGKDVEQFFEGYGRIRGIVLKKGYGFVEFHELRDAEAAVYDLNRKHVLGDRVIVDFANAPVLGRGERDSRRYGGGGYRDGQSEQPRRPPPGRTAHRVTVENLSSCVSWQNLKDYMRQAGKVTYADAHRIRQNEGVVEFASFEDMKNAVSKLDNTELSGRRIRLREDRGCSKDKNSGLQMLEHVPGLPDGGQKIKDLIDRLKMETSQCDLLIEERKDQVKELAPCHGNLYGGRMTASRLEQVGQVTSEAIERLHRQSETCPLSENEASDPDGLLVPLMRHQRQALAWLCWREEQHPPGGILADDMGLGKTLTMISLILAQRAISDPAISSETNCLNKEDQKVLKSSATLVICPASLIHQWHKEIETHVRFGLLRVIVYHGTNREANMRSLASADVVITTYTIISREVGVPEGMKKDKHSQNMPVSEQCLDETSEAGSLLSILWNRIIIDEADTIKNHTSLTAMSVSRLRSVSRWALTGTPINNNLLDMYSLLRLCNPLQSR